MRLIVLTLASALALTSGAAFAQSAAPASKPAAAPAAAGAHYTTASTQIGTLLADPAAKAVLTKHIPDMISNPQFEQASGMTLKDIQSYAADALPDKKLAEIDADLAKVPVKK